MKIKLFVFLVISLFTKSAFSYDSYYSSYIEYYIKAAQEEITIYLPITDQNFYEHIESVLLEKPQSDITTHLYLKINNIEELETVELSQYRELLSIGTKIYLYISRDSQHDKRIFIDQKYVIEGKYLTLGARSMHDVHIIDSANLAIAYLDSFQASIKDKTKLNAKLTESFTNAENEEIKDDIPAPAADDIQESNFTYHIHSDSVIPFPESVIKDKELMKKFIKHKDKTTLISYIKLLLSAYREKTYTLYLDRNKFINKDYSNEDFKDDLLSLQNQYKLIRNMSYSNDKLFLELYLGNDDFFYLNKIEFDSIYKTSKVKHIISLLVRSYLAEAGVPFKELNPSQIEENFPIRYKDLMN